MVTMGHRFDRVAGHHNVDFSSGLSFNWWNADLAVGMSHPWVSSGHKPSRIDPIAHYLFESVSVVDIENRNCRVEGAPVIGARMEWGFVFGFSRILPFHLFSQFYSSNHSLFFDQHRPVPSSLPPLWPVPPPSCPHPAPWPSAPWPLTVSRKRSSSLSSLNWVLMMPSQSRASKTTLVPTPLMPLSLS